MNTATKIKTATPEENRNVRKEIASLMMQIGVLVAAGAVEVFEQGTASSHRSATILLPDGFVARFEVVKPAKGDV